MWLTDSGRAVPPAERMNEMKITIKLNASDEKDMRVAEAMLEAAKTFEKQLQKTPAGKELPKPVPAPVTPAAPSPAPAVPTAPAVPVSAVPVAAAPTYTREQVMTAGAQLVDAGKITELQAIMQKMGVNAITELRDDQLGTVATELRGLGAQI